MINLITINLTITIPINKKRHIVSHSSQGHGQIVSGQMARRPANIDI